LLPENFTQFARTMAGGVHEPSVISTFGQFSVCATWLGCELVAEY